MAGAACDIKSIVTQRSLRDRVTDSGQTSRARIRHARQQEPGTEAPLVHDPGASCARNISSEPAHLRRDVAAGDFGNRARRPRSRGSSGLAVAYKRIALPSAGVVGAIVLISSIFMEFRHYRDGLGALASSSPRPPESSPSPNSKPTGIPY